jgi:hypothetical protein
LRTDLFIVSLALLASTVNGLMITRTWLHAGQRRHRTGFRFVLALPVEAKDPWQTEARCRGSSPHPAEGEEEFHLAPRIHGELLKLGFVDENLSSLQESVSGTAHRLAS